MSRFVSELVRTVETSARPTILPHNMVRGVTGKVIKYNCYHNRWIFDVENLTVKVLVRKDAPMIARVFPGKTRLLFITETVDPTTFDRLGKFEGPRRTTAFMTGDADYDNIVYGVLSAPRRAAVSKTSLLKRKRNVRFVKVIPTLKFFASKAVVCGAHGAFVLQKCHFIFKR